jgi:hypothetical protein
MAALAEAQLAHAARVRRWVETRPRSVRIPNGRPDKHPARGNRRAWKKEL